MSTASTPPIRSRLEFRTTLQWRLIIIAAVSVLDMAMVYARSGQLLSAMLPWYAAYGALVALLFVTHTHFGEASSEWLFPVSLCLDLVVAAIIQHRGGSAFWHGATFYALAVLVASSVLRPTGVVVVTVGAITTFVTKDYLESTGIWGWPHVSEPTRVFFSTPGYVADHMVFGTLALIVFAWIQSRLVRRVQNAESEQRAIVDASPDLILTFDRTGIVLSANAAARAALGTAAQPGTPFGFLRVALNSHDDTRRAFGNAARGEPVTIHASLCLEPGGQRQLSITFAPVFDEGNVRAVLASGRDVTDERNAVAEREGLHRQLEESRRMQLVGRLVSGVAHELNNPLSAILNHAELLRDSRALQNSDLDDGLDIIRGEARRAREIVRDLLQIARADSRRLRSNVSLNRLSCDVVAALKPLAELHEVAIECLTGRDTPSIAVDATGISQVVTNLVMNAIDACGAGGKVRVIVSADSEWARILVEDDGPGIAPNIQAHLFEPFVTTKGPGNGTGLGLAVSLGIVEQHDGRLLVEAVWPERTRRGARFTVMLPLTELSAQEQSANSDATGESLDDATDDALTLDLFNASDDVVEPRPTRRHVLIVEDEPAIRAGLHRWFTREGWTVRTVADGIEALDALRLLELEGVEVDAIICDLRMPRMGGPEFFARLETMAPELARRIIFSTGDIVSPDVHTFLKSVNVPVLEKPFEFRALASKLAELRGLEDGLGQTGLSHR